MSSWQMTHNPKYIIVALLCFITKLFWYFGWAKSKFLSNSISIFNFRSLSTSWILFVLQVVWSPKPFLFFCFLVLELFGPPKCLWFSDHVSRDTQFQGPGQYGPKSEGLKALNLISFRTKSSRWADSIKTKTHQERFHNEQFSIVFEPLAQLLPPGKILNDFLLFFILNQNFPTMFLVGRTPASLDPACRGRNRSQRGCGPLGLAVGCSKFSSML